eukprot:TRINITY_DN27055_c0_g1_i1.p1 TRINITY_DN27055_c0_g1~~TRINITY_DN27055_c0_g1_i1.p1  ORF type:complete len:101 (-),score=14.08 TRINITY_DN27055_c0_g1_i1:248-550(-)
MGSGASAGPRRSMKALRAELDSCIIEGFFRGHGRPLMTELQQRALTSGATSCPKRGPTFNMTDDHIMTDRFQEHASDLQEGSDLANEPTSPSPTEERQRS